MASRQSISAAGCILGLLWLTLTAAGADSLRPAPVAAGEPAGSASTETPGLANITSLPIRLAHRTYDLMDQEQFDDLYYLFADSADDLKVVNRLSLIPWQDLRRAKFTVDTLVQTPNVLPPGLRPRAYQIKSALERNPVIAESIRNEVWTTTADTGAAQWSIGAYNLQYPRDVEQIMDILQQHPSMARDFTEGLLRFSRQAKGYEGPTLRRQALEIFLRWDVALQQRVFQSLETLRAQAGETRTQKEARMARQNFGTLWKVRVKGKLYDLTTPPGLRGFLNLDAEDNLFVLDNLDLLVFIFENASRYPQISKAIPALEQQHLDRLAQMLLQWIQYPNPIQANVRKLLPIIDRMRGTNTLLPDAAASTTVAQAGALGTNQIPTTLSALTTALKAGQFNPGVLHGLEQVKETLLYPSRKGSIRHDFDKNKVAQWEARGQLKAFLDSLDSIDAKDHPEMQQAIGALLAVAKERDAAKHARLVKVRLLLVIGLPLLILGFIVYVNYAYPYVKFAGTRIRKENLYPVADEVMQKVIHRAQSIWPEIQQQLSNRLEACAGAPFTRAADAAPLSGLDLGLKTLLATNGATDFELHKCPPPQRNQMLTENGIQDEQVLQLINDTCPQNNGQLIRDGRSAQLKWVENILEQVAAPHADEARLQFVRQLKAARLIHKVARLHDDPENLPDSDEVLQAMSAMEMDMNDTLTEAVQSHRVHWSDADVLRKHHHRLIRAYFKKHFHVPAKLAQLREVKVGNKVLWHVWDKDTQRDSHRIRDRRVPQKRKRAAVL